MTKRLIAIIVLAAAAAGINGCAPILLVGATTGGVAAVDNRTAGSFVEDEAIEIKAKTSLLQNIGGRARYDVVSLNRVVLLIGQAPDEELRQEIEDVVASLPNIRRIVNEIELGPQASFRQTAADSLITSKVIAKLLAIQDGEFSTLHVKVITEDGIVYLMGLLTQENAAKAIEVAREVEGVRQVTQAFEYI